MSMAIIWLIESAAVLGCAFPAAVVCGLSEYPDNGGGKQEVG